MVTILLSACGVAPTMGTVILSMLVDFIVMGLGFASALRKNKKGG